MTRLCPHQDAFEFDGELYRAHEIVAHLSEYMTDARKSKIEVVVSRRTYAVTPVMEGLYDRGNVAAVMRSSEAFGFQAINIIETSKKFKQAKRVAQGADKWLDIQRWDSTSECVERLKGQGYRILATNLDEAVPIGEIAFDRPTALVFGNEKDGVSEEMLDLADGCVKMPMHGFAQSFNISVAAALCLYHIFEDRLRRLGPPGDLTEEEREILTAVYYLRTVPNAERLLLRSRQSHPIPRRP